MRAPSSRHRAGGDRRMIAVIGAARDCRHVLPSKESAAADRKRALVKMPAHARRRGKRYQEVERKMGAQRESPPGPPSATQTLKKASGWSPGWRVISVTGHAGDAPSHAVHSGDCITFDSLTVAGAAPALFFRVKKRTGFPFKFPEDELEVPEATTTGAV